MLPARREQWVARARSVAWQLENELPGFSALASCDSWRLLHPNLRCWILCDVCLPSPQRAEELPVILPLRLARRCVRLALGALFLNHDQIAIVAEVFERERLPRRFGGSFFGIHWIGSRRRGAHGFTNRLACQQF